MMSSRRRFALACLLAAVPARALAVPEADAPAADPQAGQLLVAAPGMSDPRFARTVILMVKHDTRGALGLAINRPVGDKTVAELLRAFGEDPGRAQGTLAVFAGGPLQPQAGFVVHSGEYRLPETVALDQQVAVSPPRPVLRDIADGHGPRKRMLILGYAGWAPRQLEAEMSLGAWVTAVGSPELVFDMDRTKLWEAAFARRILSL
ncbi:MAG: YqgE/AlgH family protein [Acetobacteraceae bacterium]